MTADNAGTTWNSATDNTLDAWYFGTDEPIPTLNYADYDGAGTVFDCSQFPTSCGTPLPRQAGVNATGLSEVAFGATTTITGSLVFGRVVIVSWSWEQLRGHTVTLIDANTRTATFTAPATGNFLLFELTATDSDGDQYTDRIRLSLGASVDQDGNGLIEIDSLTMLHNMRHNLAGTSYKESASAPGAAYGCPAARCRGYELTRNLDFDSVNGNGSTWSGNAEDGFTLDMDDNEAVYFPVDGDGAGGWLPIGNEANPFVAVFDGNGHTISNLAIRRNQTHIGLFGKIGNGAAIRNLGLVDNLADYTGSSNSGIFIGGLVGLQEGGSISASYATGDADGGDGNSDRVGGLVGRSEGSITASYATGDADGGGGDDDRVGGLVGFQNGGSITASYATGDADGGNGNEDRVGGLVGFQNGGSITASYAAGDADGGNGNSDNVGGLVGRQQGGSIVESYGFGGTTGGETNGSDGSTKATGVVTAADLTAINAWITWNSATNNTLGAWDFGTEVQIPALNYADYDGVDLAIFDCGQFPANACGTLLPGQDEASASGTSAVAFGANTTITGSLVFGRVAIVSWSWEQLEGPNVILVDANTRAATFTAPANGDFLLFELTATDSDGDQYTDRIRLSLGASVDQDGDGLIEIDSLTMLHNMRHNLAGTSYKESASAPGAAYGCPAVRCRGYELTKNLDFDVDGDGSTWSGNAEDGFTLDMDDNEAVYFPVADGGWEPIGDETSPFVAVFDGNGHTISNLAILRDQTHIGLFGKIGNGAAIRNLGLVDNLADYTGSSDSGIFIGGLVGLQDTGSSITASYATGDADGGDGDNDRVGGLVGRQSGGSITASYATGDADGGDGSNDRVGGLVGYKYEGSITASYATGNTDGGGGANDRVGGLVGQQGEGSITASYATGDANGGSGNSDRAGGLVGVLEDGSITASYATGDADGGSGNSDRAGGLVGLQNGGSITASYAFGETSGGEIDGSDGSAKPTGVVAAADLTANNAGSAWNSAANNTLGAWDFGTDEQIPALNYADYDGVDLAIFDCGQFPANACGTLLPGQDEVSASGTSAVAFGATTMITGSLVFGRVVIVSWSWEKLEGPNVILVDANARTAIFTVPATGDFLLFELTATDSDGDQYTDRIRLSLGASVDQDGNGLIEIDNLTMLHNMRHNLAGTSYKESGGALGAAYGCPAARCRGYELTRDLDFDSVNGNGSTWSGNAEDGFTLDMDDNKAVYFPVDGDGAGGWLPIGDEANPFVAVFDGNGHTISNLAIRREQTYVGLFGATVGDIRNLGLVDNLADYTGSDDGNIYIGGLVGRQGTSSSITASYATGDADGGVGSADRVGGLVGLSQGSITASYATGDADGGDGSSDYVGGLVGQQGEGSITASYATGYADGGDGDSDNVGGLVGRSQGSITASYATGYADGGDGDSDNVGGLVGLSQGSITASYGFGGTIGGEAVGSDGSPKPQGVSTAAQLAEANAGPAWNNAVNNTLGAWDFGTDEQIPALNYADYDGAGTVFNCSQFPAGACDTQLPRHAEVNAVGLSAVAFGAATTISGSFLFGRDLTIESWSWEQLQGPNVTLVDVNNRTATFTAPANGDFLLFELTAMDSGGDQYTDRILLFLGASVDPDGDGLIEINSLTMLHNMRYNLAGTSYKESANAPGAAYGCSAAGCRGYELTRNLDFDGDGNGSTWSGNAEDGFTLDMDDNEAVYFPVDVDGAGGWLPIGNGMNPFVAVFDGNGHTISNLAIRRELTYVGLFGATVGGIHNLGLVDNLADYTGSSNNAIFIGGLVGRSQGSISTSYATGDADGGDGDSDRVGGLVGRSQGSITASYATGDADGGVGDDDRVGGLVGFQNGGSITASYATGDADGGVGVNDRVGGLVGWKQGGSITASYATGDADGGNGNSDNVGGLVGRQQGGSITASYAAGDADGGVGNNDNVGGLVGWNQTVRTWRVMALAERPVGRPTGRMARQKLQESSQRLI